MPLFSPALGAEILKLHKIDTQILQTMANMPTIPMKLLTAVRIAVSKAIGIIVGYSRVLSMFKLHYILSVLSNEFQSCEVLNLFRSDIC